MISYLINKNVCFYYCLKHSGLGRERALKIAKFFETCIKIFR
jgi:hypothetical protein